MGGVGRIVGKQKELAAMYGTMSCATSRASFDSFLKIPPRVTTGTKIQGPREG